MISVAPAPISTRLFMNVENVSTTNMSPNEVRRSPLKPSTRASAIAIAATLAKVSGVVERLPVKTPTIRKMQARPARRISGSAIR